MKKLLSLVMAGAMVASLVPATAFATGEVSATAKVVDLLKLTKNEANDPNITLPRKVPEAQLKISGVDYRVGDTTPSVDVEFTLDNAEFPSTSDASLLGLLSIKDDVSGTPMTCIISGGGTAEAAHYTGTELNAAGEYMVLTTKVGDAKVPATDVKKIPTYSNIDAKGVQAQYADLIAAGYQDGVTPGFDISTQLYTAGSVVKSGSPVIDLTTLAPLPAKSIADQENEWILANAPTTSYKRCTGTFVDATASTGGTATFTADSKIITVTVKEKDDENVTFKFVGRFNKDDVISLKLESKLTKKSEGTQAKVSISSKAVTADDLVYVNVLGQGLTVSVKKLVDVAEDEKVTLNSNGLKIKAAVGEFASGANATEITLKLSNGFEFVKNNMGTADYADVAWVDDNEIKLTVNTALKDEITLKGTQIEATSAKSGAIATITAKSPNVDSGSCEVAKVCDYKVNLTVDEDEDVPVIYSGTNVANTGLTDDSDHMSLEVTAEETFPGAWSMRQGFNFNLPDGVYVTKVDVTDTENFVYTVNNVKNDVDDTKWEEAFFDAYQNGDHKNFEFKKRVFDDVNQELETKPAKVTFQLQLVADPTFEGDVVVTFEGSLVDTQSVTIAKFVKPYTVKAEQNDVIIDYRNTAINTAITITEAAEGLLKENTEFTLLIEDNLIDFDGDPKVAADDASEMTIKDDDTTNGTFVFEIDDESDSAATITISDMELFMNRSIPAGGYDLKISTTMSKAYDAQVLFAPDNATTYAGMAAAVTAANAAWVANARTSANTTVKDTYIDDVTDYSSTVKEAFINVVTSGRDQDNLFTTKVVVPVGEGYLVAGETKVTLDAPAYISAAGYTMLPVRAVSRALGVDTNNVLWSAETKTVTIMFAQRIISMTVGQKTIYVNGSAIPSSAAPEIKDGRTFLPLRDLGTALGVTNVSWDSATKTATLN